MYIDNSTPDQPVLHNSKITKAIHELCSAGLYLVPIPPDNGRPTKAPRNKGWNSPRSSANPNGYSNNPEDFLNCDGFNFGLYHGASNTLALDLDDVELARKVFDELTDLQLLDWLESDVGVGVKSPKANRDKLLFKLPADFNGAGLRQLKHGRSVVFELRAGNCQDVVLGRHPEGGEYQLVGNLAKIPPVPRVLLDILEHWPDWKPCFDSALGIEQMPLKIRPRKPQHGEQLSGWRDPIQEFNDTFSPEEILLRNGYTATTVDRFIRPDSSSGAPGVVILRNCKDGIERVYSHGGDKLNDGHPHDAFDCYQILECGGDLKMTLGWNPEITKHNQRLYMQEQAKNAPEFLQQGDDSQGQARTLFPLIPASELTLSPIAIDWLVENILERGSLNLLFGEPGAGKSLFALDWAFCMAADIQWHGYHTQETDVVIVAGEGFAGMARRLKALEAKYQMKAPGRLFISQKPAQLSDAQNAQSVADSIKAVCSNPGLVIIDTLHRNMEGDENSSQDIGRFIGNLDNYLKPLGAAILVVHHSGHGQKDRSRGSSSIRAAMDGEFSATNNGNAIVLSCHKAKDFEAFKPLQFRLKPIDLEWSDDVGVPLRSVYLDHDGEAKPSSTQKPKLTAREDVILASLGCVVAEYGIEPTAEIKADFRGFDSLDGGLLKVVHIDHWRNAVYPRLDAETAAGKQKAFKRARDKLFELGKVTNWHDYWWPVYD